MKSIFLRLPVAVFAAGVSLAAIAGCRLKPAVVTSGSAIREAVDQQNPATNGAARPGAITKADLNPAMSDSKKAIPASHKNR